MLPHCLQRKLHWCSCLAARTLSWRNKRRMSTCSTAACPRKKGRNSTAAASSSWDHLCYKKARKMKCQLWLSESINVAFIYHPTASDLQSNQLKLQILPLQLLFHKGVKNTAFTSGLFLATTKAEVWTSQTSSCLNWNDEIADGYPKLYLYILHIYNLAHQVTPTKWNYSSNSGIGWSRAGKGSIQPEVCFLARKKGHMHMTALGFY